MKTNTYDELSSTVTGTPASETETVAAIVAAAARLGLAASTRLRRDEIERARRAADEILHPLIPSDLRHWLVSPGRGESLRAYARRASRYACARCAEAGYGSPAAIYHQGADYVGSLSGHGSGSGVDGPAIVSRIERAISATADEPTDDDSEVRS